MADAKSESQPPSTSEHGLAQTTKEDGKWPHHHHRKETHGMRDDINEHTSLVDVKAPNVFERAKEEIEALVQTIHAKKESHSHESREQTAQMGSEVDASNPPSEKDSKASHFIHKAKEEIQGMMHFKNSPRHHCKETHGLNDEIDRNTPISEVKAPNVFERAKEEIDAFVEAIHQKKESRNQVDSSPKKEGGFRSSVGKGFEKVCSPFSHKRD